MLRELIGKPANRYKIEYKSFLRLQKIALKHLNVPDMNKLRDKFEGQKYYNSFLLKAFAELTFEKVTGQEIYNWEQKELQKAYKPNLELEGKSVELIFADLDSYPLIPRGNYDIGVIIFINIDSRDTMVMGYASQTDLIDNANTSSLSPMFETNFIGHLKNLDILTPFEEKDLA